jgi:hypothetical protein
MVAAHRRRRDGSGAVVRDEGHVIAVERAALAVFSPARPQPQGPAARSATPPAPRRPRILGEHHLGGEQPGQRIVVDLAGYAALVPPDAAATTPPRRRTPLLQREIR